MSSAEREMVNMQLQFNATSSFISMCICVCWVTRSLNSKLFFFFLLFSFTLATKKKLQQKSNTKIYGHWNYYYYRARGEERKKYLRPKKEGFAVCHTNILYACAHSWVNQSWKTAEISCREFLIFFFELRIESNILE